MIFGECMKERKRESAIGLSGLDGFCAGDCKTIRLSLGVVGDSRTIGRYIGVAVEAMMECILWAKDVGVGSPSSFCGIPSGGVIRLGIGETASSSPAAVEADLDNVGDGLNRSAVTIGSERLDDGDSSGPVVLALVCFQNRCKGVGDATLPTSY